MSQDGQLPKNQTLGEESELDRLRKDAVVMREKLSQLMHVNSQWDLEYREQEEAFRRYRADSQLAAKENHDAIARLKEENEALKMEKRHLWKSSQHQEDHLFGGVQQLELYKRQLKAYQEDFDAERREKERLMVEKQNERLRLQAEITSLQLQLDRCRTELSHYSSEATRLAHQLKIRNQVEQEQYRRSLESKGYVSRSPDAPLPPLDPFVEADHTHHSLLYKHGSQPLVSKPSSSQPIISSCNAGALPPSTEGNHPCPRCARRFVQWAELEDHKMKCLQY